MDEKEFIKLCKKAIVDYANTPATWVGSENFKEYRIVGEDLSLTEDDIYTVWLCKTLQNNKALMATTRKDYMYYELTYNGDKKELYLDAYKKIANVKHEIVSTTEEG